MRKHLAITGTVAAVGVLVWVLLANAARTTPTKFINIAAPAFVPRDYSVHNNGSAVCGNAVAHNGDGENRGDLDNAEGSYIAPVSLPGGTRVRSLSVFVNDNDGAADVHAYLVRKRIAHGLNPKDLGYTVMARAQSSGAVNNVMRRFADRSVVAANVDNTRFMYYVELVVCPVTEPFAVRITYR
jgi:hypothetical protein